MDLDETVRAPMTTVVAAMAPPKIASYRHAAGS
jgi:hypothetical protein